MKTRLTLLSAFVLLAVGSVSAATVRYVDANSASPAPPYTNWATAARVIQDAVDAAVPGNEIVVTNGVYAAGGRALFSTMTNRVAVDKPLTLRSVNGPQFTIIQGYQVPGADNGYAEGAIRCVYLASGASLFGFTVTNGAADSGGGVWCESASAVVSNCTLMGNSASDLGGGAYHGTLYDCTLSSNRAGNGGGVAWAVLNNCALTGDFAGVGGGAYLCTLNYCRLVGNGSLGTGIAGGGGAFDGTLNNCTLTGNSANGLGGGVWGGMLDNCTLSDNSATSGGGAYAGTLNNCTLVGNSADRGGGAWGSTLNNCTVIGNSASYGGGCFGGGSDTLKNCIVYFNSEATGPNYASDYSSFRAIHCCTTPLPTNGVGNITNAPLFVNYAGGNLRLQSNSPCINAGLNAYAPGPTDLDGNPRIVSGTVDIGAYEYQGPGSVISYAWLQQFGLPTDGSADATDPDADGHTTWQEWRCQTCPTNALSALRLLSATPDRANVTVRWQSVAGVEYSLERSADLLSSPQFVPVASGIPGQPGTTVFTDTNAPRSGPFFYRVGVGN